MFVSINLLLCSLTVNQYCPVTVHLDFGLLILDSLKIKTFLFILFDRCPLKQDVMSPGCVSAAHAPWGELCPGKMLYTDCISGTCCRESECASSGCSSEETSSHKSDTRIMNRNHSIVNCHKYFQVNLHCIEMVWFQGAASCACSGGRLWKILSCISYTRGFLALWLNLRLVLMAPPAT